MFTNCCCNCTRDSWGALRAPTRTPFLRLVKPHVLGARLRAPSEPQEALRLAH